MKTKILFSIVAISIGLFTTAQAETQGNTYIQSDNPWLAFDDETYTGGGGPSTVTQWWFQADINSNATVNKFYLIDSTDSNEKVLLFNGGANSYNSMVVDSSGDIGLANGSVFIDRSENNMGIGTSTPTSNLDIKSFYNAEIALENGSGSARWIMRAGGGTTDFYLVDTVNNDKQPFYVENNTSSNTLYLKDTGNVGIGTNLPSAKLDVRGDIEATFSGAGTESVYKLLTLSANDTDGTGPSEAAFVLRNEKAGLEWLFRTIDNGTAFTATLGGTGGAEFKIVSDEGDYTKTKLYIGGKLVFANGKILSDVLP